MSVPARPKQPCSVECCEKMSYLRGLCRGHYHRFQTLGEDFPRTPLNIHRVVTPEMYKRRLFSRFTVGDGCWEWTAGVHHKEGYGQMQNYVTKKTGLAHRIMYELFVGPIPAGLQIDHLCRNRRCVRPDHMEVVTNEVNSLRGAGVAALNARITHCHRGHPFSGDNLYLAKRGDRLKRVCRACQNERSRKKRSRPAAVPTQPSEGAVPA